MGPTHLEAGCVGVLTTVPLSATLRQTAYRILTVLLLALSGLATAGTSQQALSNDDVINLVDAGVSPVAVVARIKASPVNFDLSVDALKTLFRAGVPDEVMMAMIRAQVSATKFTSSPTTAEPKSTELSLPLGHGTRLGRLTVTVLRADTSYECPGGSAIASILGGLGKPARGAKFVIVEAAARNENKDVIDVPRVTWTLDTYEEGLGAGFPCRYNDEAFGNACHKSGGKLFPGVECEGWVLFEVPDGFDLADATLGATVSGGDIARWHVRR